MRIAYVLTQDLESPSGLGRYLPLARQLVRRGHQVRISALHSNYQALEATSLTLDGVEVHYVAPMHVQKQGSLKHYYGALKLLGITCQASVGLTTDTWRSKADIIHVGKPHPMNGIAGLISTLRYPDCLCVDCDDYETGSMQFSAAWQKHLVALFEKHIPKAARLVTVNTQFMHQKLLEWGIADQKIFYLPNGVDAERFSRDTAGEIEDLRQNLGLGGKQVVAYIGSLSLPSHPVDLLLRTFEIIARQSPATSLLIVGGGGDYDALVEMTARMGLGNQVVFAGRVAPMDVPLYYQLADVTVDPVYDNDAARGRSPLKLFESWVCGVPFVTAPVGDRIALLKDSQAGLLTPDSSPEAYANAIQSILTTPALADALSMRGLQAVRQYTWEHLAAQLEQVYHSLCQENKGKA